MKKYWVWVAVVVLIVLGFVVTRSTSSQEITLEQVANEPELASGQAVEIEVYNLGWGNDDECESGYQNKTYAVQRSDVLVSYNATCVYADISVASNDDAGKWQTVTARVETTDGKIRLVKDVITTTKRPGP